MIHVTSLWTWDLPEILPNIAYSIENGNGWMLYVFGAFILGVLLGGLVKGITKLVLSVILFSGFAILILMLLQKQDLLSMIASVVFGVIMLVTSFLVKIGKYPLPKG
jgi:hypothetical protein